MSYGTNCIGTYICIMKNEKKGCNTWSNLSFIQSHLSLSKFLFWISQFVAHPNCQQLLASLWYKGLPGFRSKHIIFKVLLSVTMCLMYPILSILYILAPKSAIGRLMRRPFIKFVCHSASYMTFLCEWICLDLWLKKPFNLNIWNYIFSRSACSVGWTDLVINICINRYENACAS